MHILIVDDYQPFINCLKEALETMDYHEDVIVDCAESYDEAKTKIDYYDCLVVDYKLNGHTGLQFCTDYFSAYPDARVIMVSGVDLQFDHAADWATHRDTVRKISKFVIKNSSSRFFSKLSDEILYPTPELIKDEKQIVELLNTSIESSENNGALALKFFDYLPNLKTDLAEHIVDKFYKKTDKLVILATKIMAIITGGVGLIIIMFKISDIVFKLIDKIM